MLAITLFVDADAAPAGDGLAWASAYDDLQSALTQAATFNSDGNAATDVDQIWIAEGTYTPSAELESGDARSASFSLLDSVTLYGGFDGSEATLNARDWSTHVTTLSGDLGTLDDNSDNAYTVVYCGGSIEAGIDGVVISGGNADRLGSLFWPAGGGGIYNSGALTVENCTITENSAGDGGGIYSSGTLTVTDSTFLSNSVGEGGGGIYSSGTLTVTACAFSNNSAIDHSSGYWNASAGGCGGGVYSYSGTVLLTDSTFSGNSAEEVGGGIFCNSGALTVTNSAFLDNSADHGGGIFSNSEAMIVTESTFSGNSADGTGGGFYNNGNLTVTNSTFSDNSASYVSSSLTDLTAGSGGGIYSKGTLTVANCTLSGNSASHSGDVPSLISLGSGGGIFSNGMLMVTNSTLLGNSANNGGGIFGWSTLTVSNSVFSGNSAAYNGGAICNDGTLTLTNATVSGNSARNDSGGIQNAGTLILANSIVTSNSGSNILDIRSPTNSSIFGSCSATNSLIGIDPAFARAPTAGADGEWGTLDDDPGDLHLTDRSLAINAGSNSLAVDADNNPLTTDLEENPRIADGTVDIGAYEYQGPPASGRETPSLVVSAADDEFDLYDGEITLREAIYYSQSGIGDGIVTFDAALDGATITLTGWELLINHSIVIDASALSSLTVDADNLSRVFHVTAEVTLSGLTITGGSTGGMGGGIYSDGMLTLMHSTLSGNSADLSGGAIHNAATLTVTNSTLSGNSADSSGGAIHSAGTLTVTNSTLSGNSADSSGGGIIAFGTLTVTNSTLSGNSADDGGGGIFSSGTLTLTNSTLSGNSANGGGGINSYGTLTVGNSSLSGNSACSGGGIYSYDGMLTVTNSTLSGNSATDNGGGVYRDYGTLAVTNSTLSGNSSLVGGGIYSSENGTATVTNSIIALNSADTDADFSGTPTPESGFNLIGGDPLFVRNPSPGVDAVWGTADDDYGDLQLALGSLAIDAGSNDLAVDSEGDPLLSDILGNIRIHNGTVDIGAYEFGSVLLALADLSLQQSVSDPTPAHGEQVTFTVTLTNDGPDEATNIEVENPLPVGLVGETFTPDMGSYDSGTGIWSVPSLPAEAGSNTAVLTITGTVDVWNATITNVAEVVAGEQTDPDSTPANGDQSEDDYAEVSVSVSTPNLTFHKPLASATIPNDWEDSIVIRRDGDPQGANSTDLTNADVLYVDVAVINDGGSDAGAFAIDVFVDGSATPLLLPDGSASHTCEIEGLTPGQFKMLSIPLSVPPAAQGHLAGGGHTVKVKIDPADSVAEDPEDNEGSRSFDVFDGDPDLALVVPTGWEEEILIATTADATANVTPITDIDTPIFRFGVGNIGNDQAGEFVVSVLLDGDELDTITIPSLYSGQVTELTLTMSGPLSLGEHTIEIKLDVDDQVVEPNDPDDPNNNASRTFDVIGSGQISGTSLFDANGDGIIQPDEGGFEGRTVFLDTNGNGLLDAGEQSQVTDAQGNYSFTNLVPGVYRVVEQPLVSYTQTDPATVDFVEPSGSGLDIQFKLNTDDLPTGVTEDDLKDALEEAAAQVESWFFDPITVVIDVTFDAIDPELGETHGLAHAESTLITEQYTDLREMLIADAAADERLVDRLPEDGMLFFEMPDGDFTIGNFAAHRANLLALGVAPDAPNMTNPDDYSQYADEADLPRDGIVTFDTTRAGEFDYDPSDGVDDGKFDFVSIAVHEALHVLGFSSVIDQADRALDKADGQSCTLQPTTLDLFRIPRGLGVGSFENSMRILDPAYANQVLYDGGVVDATQIAGIRQVGDIPVSTGAINGDGYQGSHFLDDATSGVLLGMMDPTIATGTTREISSADARMLGLIGWDLGASQLGNHTVALGPGSDVAGEDFISTPHNLTYLELLGQEPDAGKLHYDVLASRDGILTVELNAGGGAATTITVCDENGTSLADDPTRVDYDGVVAGQRYQIKIEGLAGNADLVLANLVTPNAAGTQLTVFGTDEANTFVAAWGAPHWFTIDGLAYDSANYPLLETIAFFGGEGEDTITVTGSAADDEIVLHPNSGSVTNDDISVTLDGMESITVIGGGGVDTASLHDSRADDTFTASPAEAQMTDAAGSYLNRVEGMSNVHGYATAGTDTANWTGAAGSPDVFMGKTGFSQLEGDGYYLWGRRFEKVTATGQDDNDLAKLYDGSGDDTLVANPDSATMKYDGSDENFVQADGFNTVQAYATLGTDTARLTGQAGSRDVLTGKTGFSQLEGEGYLLWGRRFEQVTATGQDNSDLAKLYDGSGDDALVADPDSATIEYNGSETNFVRADGFRYVQAYATYDGNDMAELHDSAATADRLIALAEASRLHGPDFYARAIGFETIDAHVNADDTVKMYDSAGNDVFDCGPDFASMQYDGGPLVRTHGGSINLAFSTAGGIDTANMHDAAATADRFVAKADYGKLYGPGFFTKATGFGKLIATATPGQGDVAQLCDGSGADIFEASPTSAKMKYNGSEDHFAQADGFRYVHGLAEAEDTPDVVDIAYLTDSAGNDTLEAYPDQAKLYKKDDEGEVGFYSRAKLFDEVHASGGGLEQDDWAFLYDSAGNDDLEYGGNRAQVSSTDTVHFLNEATAFKHIRASNGNGGIDGKLPDPMTLGYDLDDSGWLRPLG